MTRLQFLVSTPDRHRHLPRAQAQEAVTKLSYCQVPGPDGWHVCIEVENPPRIGYGEDEQPRMVIRGM